MTLILISIIVFCIAVFVCINFPSPRKWFCPHQWGAWEYKEFLTRIFPWSTGYERECQKCGKVEVR